MKKIFLKISYRTGTKGAMVAPGVFKIATPTSGDTAAVLVLNHIPNEMTDYKGGWNFMFLRGGSLKFSKKVNPLYDADNVSPFIPQYIPANFVDVTEALVAYNADENVQNAQLETINPQTRKTRDYLEFFLLKKINN